MDHQTDTDQINVLQEQQRLKQHEMLDRWIQGTLTEQRRSRRWKIFFRFVFALFLFGSLLNTMYFFYVMGSGDSGEQHVGVVRVEGIIDSESDANAERINKGLRRAMDSEQTMAVVMRINSPGGSPVQSQRVYREVRHLREVHPDKPLLAVIGDIGASGAYYIASAAEDIYAAPSSLVGSIGVIHAGFGLEKIIDRLGVERRLFTAGENKAFLDPFTDVPEEQRAFWEEVLATTHQQFIHDVRQGRGDRLSQNDELFSGLVWTGEQARPLGLVDGVKTLEQLARDLAGEVKIRDYTPRLSPLERLGRKIEPTVTQALGIMSSNQSPIRFQLQ